VAKWWLWVGVPLAALCFSVGSSSAAYTTSCANPPGAPDPNTITDDAIETRNLRIEYAAGCMAVTERLAAIHAQLSVVDPEDSATVAQRVSLVPSDRQRLDLAWWALWALVGLTLCLLFANKWHSAWRFLRE
jgi:hypothetical protein